MMVSQLLISNTDSTAADWLDAGWAVDTGSSLAMQAASKKAAIKTTASRKYDVALIKFIVSLSSTDWCSSVPRFTGIEKSEIQG